MRSLVNREVEETMLFHTRPWPIGRVIAVGLGTIVLSHWTHQSQAAVHGPLVLVEDTTTGQSQSGTGTDGLANSADEALRADTSWSIWPPATDF
jgi:hypothetical protein